MSPLVRKRLEQARAGAQTKFVEVLAPDVRAACEALPPDAITARLLGVCAKVIPSRSGKAHEEPPSPRVWLAVSDLDHLLKEGGP